MRVFFLTRAVQSKEAEASRLGVELRAAKEREAAQSRELAMAKASLVSVQGMVRDMQATNDELLVRLEALEVNMMFKVRTHTHTHIYTPALTPLTPITCAMTHTHTPFRLASSRASTTPSPCCAHWCVCNVYVRICGT